MALRTKRFLLSAFTALALGCFPAAEGRANDSLPASIQSTLHKTYEFSSGEVQYFEAMHDLNEDGRPEIIVHVVGPMACGTGGGNTHVFTPQGSGYRSIGTISITRPPVRASSRRSRGWRNLIVGISGGGIAPGDAEIKFDGKKYASNPTVPPVQRARNLTGATVLIAPFDTFTSGKLLSMPTPGFDCTKAASPAERTICSDVGLAALDRKLSEVFPQALKNWPPNIAAEERKKQTEWLVARDRCASSPEPSACLEASYKRRIAELQIQSGLLMAPKPADWVCQGREGFPFTVAFYEETDPSSAVITFNDEQVIALGERSLSGSKYTVPDVEFWTKGNEAIVVWRGSKFTCKTRN